MQYRVIYTNKSKKFLDKLNQSDRLHIKAWIEKFLFDTDNVRKYGKALKGQFAGLWRYRVGDYRIIAKIEDKQLIIYIVTVDHRKQVYR